MAELITKQLQALQFNSEVATAADVSSFVNASTTELSSSLIARIQALEGFSTFIGVKDALPESAENGQIVIVGEKEYIWGPKADGVAGWTELGDTTAEAAAIDELSGAVASLETTKANVSDVNASVEALTKAINDVEASLSGYDTVGSAAAAEEAAISAANAYTDEQIAAVEADISSLTDVVETKADQTAVDAAISAINENISTLSAKAEEDPVFTAWKDGGTISLGSGADASNDNGPAIAIGSGASASNNGTAIGWDSIAYGIDAIAIGEGAQSESGVAIGKSAVSNGTNSIRIGTDAGADGDSLGAMVQLGSQEINPIANGINEDVIFKVFGYTVLNDAGKLETANLAGMDTLKTALNSVAEVTASDDVAKLRATVNALAAAIKTFAGL